MGTCISVCYCQKINVGGSFVRSVAKGTLVDALPDNWRPLTTKSCDERKVFVPRVIRAIHEQLTGIRNDPRCT